MKIYDKIYGEFIVEDVLAKLLQSQPVQRLKNIHQGGAGYLVNSQWNITRYDHSVGVMLLIRKLGGSIEEQIAGLLHDVSHTAFSHVVDFVMKNNNEDYHEQIYKEIIERSEIPTILNHYGYDYTKLLFNMSQWSILEQSAPDLCADRIDYTLRDMLNNHVISMSETNEFLENILVKNGNILLQSIESAKWFVNIYYKEVIDFFMDPLNIYSNDVLAKTLSLAISKNIISLQTLQKNDEEVIAILKSSNDADISSLLNTLHYNVIVIEDQSNYDLHRKNKLRLVDPLVLQHNKQYRASELDADLLEINRTAKQKAEIGMYVKIITN